MKCDGIVMPGNEIMKDLEEEGYKCLGILEIDNVKHEEMKEKLKKEYIRRVRSMLKSKLNGGNIIQAINARAVSIIRYGAGIIMRNKKHIMYTHPMCHFYVKSSDSAVAHGASKCFVSSQGTKRESEARRKK